MYKKILLIFTAFILSISISNLCFSATYYVTNNGNDQDSGTTWSQALSTIKKAISIAQTDDQIWVTEGTYQEGSTIDIPTGVSLYGGFAGSENSVSERNIPSHPTIIDGNNSYQCVKNYGYIDGYHVTKGKTTSSGGGIYNGGGTITNCTVYSNSITGTYSSGGGIDNESGTIMNCTIYSNSASDYGGGICNWGGTITNCTVYSNSATGYSPGYSPAGGGIYNASGAITNCTVYSTSGSDCGGGICNWGGTITNCTVYSNSATYFGGGIYNRHGSIITNCIVYSNSVTYYAYGGGIYNEGGTITNCTVYSNSASYEGGGIYNYSGTITNCIVWNSKNSGDIYNYGTTSVSYSCFGESSGSNGNIKANPLFVNTSGDISIWNFHLQDASPCIDSGTDSGAPVFDIQGVRRPQGLSCDMGAYESTKQFPDNTHFISQSVPDSLIAGSQYQATVVMQNTGTNTWTNTSGYYLGIIANPSNLWGIDKAPLLESDSIATSETKTFTFAIDAPTTAGSYMFQCQMLKAPQTWFGEMTDLVKIQVYVPGDINGDGVVNSADVDLVKNHILGKAPLTSQRLLPADANSDGKIDVSDIVAMLLVIKK
jgi:hypothetical protein